MIPSCLFPRGEEIIGPGSDSGHSDPKTIHLQPTTFFYAFHPPLLPHPGIIRDCPRFAPGFFPSGIARKFVPEVFCPACWADLLVVAYGLPVGPWGCVGADHGNFLGKRHLDRARRGDLDYRDGLWQRSRRILWTHHHRVYHSGRRRWRRRRSRFCRFQCDTRAGV